MSVALLVALQRSGTHALASVLEQHPDISYASEVFHPFLSHLPTNYFHFLDEIVKSEPELLLPGAAAARLERYLSSIEREATKRITLLDVKYSSMHHFNGVWQQPGLRPAFLAQIMRADIPIIHLTRRNFLRMLVSGVMADNMKVYHTTKPSNFEIVPVRLKREFLLFNLQRQQVEANMMARLLAGYRKMVTIDYLELFDENRLTRSVEEKICGLLDISPLAERKPAYVKQTPQRLEEAVENFDEVAQMLRGTPFEWMLTEP